MESGIELIASERQRQIEKKGWTPEHDDRHHDGELAKAAICYAAPKRIFEMTGDDTTPLRDPWPRRWNSYWDKRQRDQHGVVYPNEALDKDQRIRNLVKAGALIAAEIDRLQRKPGK